MFPRTAASTRAQRNTDCDEFFIVRKTPPTPRPGIWHLVDGYGALSVGQIGGVISLEPLAGRPVVAAEPIRLPRSNTPSKRSIGLPCSNHWAIPAPSLNPPRQTPDHVTVSSGSGRQSHSRQPVFGSKNQLPSWHGAVQLICSESGPTTLQCCAKAAFATSVSASTWVHTRRQSCIWNDRAPKSGEVGT